MADADARPAVIGLGNAMRGDDAAGLAVARLVGEAEPALAALAHEGSPLDLIDVWEGRERVVLVDAMTCGAEAGSVHRFELDQGPPPAGVRDRVASTHALGLLEAVEVARALGRLPGRLVLYGVQGESFALGVGLSEAVAAVIPDLARRAIAEARRPARSRRP